MSSTLAAAIGSLAFLAITARPIAPPSKPGSLQRVATLATARSVHTMTVLTSGEVLVVGGMTDGWGSLASAELFDPVARTTRTLGSLASRRSGHTATLLRNGSVLIAGGYDGGYLSSLELFDPATSRFRSAGSLLEGRSGHTATLLPDGRVLFIGGVGDGWSYLTSAELYDPATGRSERVGAMAVPRESHTATLLADGRVLVTGGHAGRRQNMEVYATTEIFSPRSARFEAGGRLATARHKHDAVVLADGRVLVIGGADRTDRLYYATTEIYDPVSNRFRDGPSMNHRRYKIAGTSVLLGDGSVLVTSGASVAERLDPQGRRFEEVPGRLSDAYRFAAVAPLPDGDVVITGGYDDGNRNTAGVWRFQYR